MPHVRVNLDTVATGNQDNLRGCRGIVCGHMLIPLQRNPDLGTQLLECVCVGGAAFGSRDSKINCVLYLSDSDNLNTRKEAGGLH